MKAEIDGIPHPPETVTLKTEILVLGGGLPGVCAAIQAARMGCGVTLIEKRLTLGGNCGPEIGVHPSDAHRFHPYMVSTGIVGELIEDAAFYGAKTKSQDAHYNASTQWDTVMSAALRRAGVRVLRGMYAHTPYVANNRITAVLCEDTMHYKRLLIKVSGFMIDDSGDGNVSALAGAGWRMGRESKAEYGERLAPEKADSITMGSSLVSLIRNTGAESPFYPSDMLPPFYPGYGGDGPFIPEDGANLYFWFPTETGGEKNTIEDSLEIYERLRGHLESAWDRAKNVLDDGPLKNWEMVWVSPQVGKRESRRFYGDYTLTESDVENGRIFSDAVAVGGFAFDIHYPKPEKPEYVHVQYRGIPPLYTIPYRCIYSKDIDNLFFASRLLSVSHIAHGSVRLQRTLATIGQAAGLAAAYCVKHSLSPRELYQKHQVPALQQLLLREDATIPGIINQDPFDLARSASVSSSSELHWNDNDTDTFEPINTVAGAEIWNFANQIQKCIPRLRNSTDRPISVACSILRYHAVHPWQEHYENPFFDYYPVHNEAEWGSVHRLDRFERLKEVNITVPPRYSGWYPIDFDLDIAPKNCLSDDDRLAFVLKPDVPGLEIARKDGLYSGVRSLEGLTEEGGVPAYLVTPRSVALRLEPAPQVGEASQVLNGVNRRFSENPKSMWQPASLPASLVLRWKDPIEANQIRITFDTLTRAALEMPYESKQRASKQCVKEFSVKLFYGASLVHTISRENWYHRLAVLDCESVVFDRLVLELEALWDQTTTPGVYEIRVYNTDQRLRD